MTSLLFGVRKLFTVIVIDFNFLETTIHSVGCSIRPIAAGLQNIKPQVRSDHDLDLSTSRDIISHVIIQCAPCNFL